MLTCLETWHAWLHAFHILQQDMCLGHFAVQGERTVLMCMTCVQVNANYQATLSGNKNAIISYPAS